MDAVRKTAGEEFPPISAELLDAATRVGQSYGVSGELDPADHLFWYSLNEMARIENGRPVEFYFDSGFVTAHFLRDLLAEPRLESVLAQRAKPDEPVSILEFASGYGRVSRFFPVVLPQASAVACDIHARAVAFLRRIGLQAVLSSSVPEQFDTGRTFDVVFALSFFTHMPRATWTRWLRALASQLVPGGLLIFTTHGKVSQGLMGLAELEADGFHFVAASEQKDLPVAEYGNTVTTFGFVYSQMEEASLSLLQYKEAGIAHHDVYVLQRGPDPKAPAKASASKNGEIARLEAEIAALRGSTSWKITAPLRAMVDSMRGR